MNKQNLIDFEDDIVKEFEAGNIPFPVHFSGGNEDQLIDIFKNIKSEDWVFSTHRSHYHYLLKGGSPEKLKKMILTGQSMHVFDRSINFFTSAIVGGCPTIATGIAMSLKNIHVWCFIGDGAQAEGAYYESVLYATQNNLPITFIIEDNGLSVDTPVKSNTILNSTHILTYKYIRKYPHVNTGKFISQFSGEIKWM